MILAKDLIAKFQYALDQRWGYIYGKSHEMWSDAKQKAYAKEYANDPDRANSCKYGGKWVGHWVTDCSGLFAWSFSQLGGAIAHGSNSIWNKYCTSKGTMARGNRTDGETLMPGTAVFTSSGDRHNHIGLYVGNGMVIEAQGAQAGVVQSLATNKKWTHWGELKNVKYEKTGEENSMAATAKVVLPAGASGNTVNMRASDSKTSKILTTVPEGTTVTVSEDKGQWCHITYNGFDGWMMSNYLEYEGQGDETTGDVLTVADKKTIEDALSEIGRQTEIIRATIGRG